MKAQHANVFGFAGTDAGSKGHGFGQFVARLVQAIRKRGEEHDRYVQTREELMALTDRELSDIGLLRGDIERVARQAAESVA